MNPIRLLSGLALVLTALPVAIHAEQIAITFDPTQAEVDYSVGTTLHTVHGTFLLKSGEFRFDPATGEASGQLIVDPTTGGSGSHARDNRMQKEILEAAKFAEITFLPDRIEGNPVAEGTSRIQVHGRFRIHGADHELTIPVDVQSSGGRYTASTRFDVPYVQWGMKNPSTLILRVKDKAEISIRAVAHVAR
jgi:polyisoprenoid-binding protein YceI